jgi:hypothetical protein
LVAPATIPSHLIAFKASRGRADDHSMGAVGYAWRVANDYLEMVWKSSGYPEDPVPDVGQGAHWMSEHAPRAGEQIKAGGSAFRRSIAEAEREVAAAIRLLAHKGISAVRTAWQRDPEIMAGLAVLGVYEQQLMAGLARFGWASQDSGPS